MKLRTQLVLSHVGLVLVSAVCVGTVSLFLTLRTASESERTALEHAAAMGAHAFQRHIEALRRAARDGAAVVPHLSTANPVLATATLHEVLHRHRCERLEVFTGLELTAAAYRWERGADPALRTAWLPGDPRVAARIASGQEAVWVERTGEGRAAVKVCAPVPRTHGAERRWVVISEPLDTPFLSTLAPPRASLAVRVGDLALTAWQPGVFSAAAAAAGGEGGGPAGMERLFAPVRAARVVRVLDSGRPLVLALQQPPAHLADTFLRGLQAWFLVALAALLLAGVLGSGLATRILAPLQALLEGTSAMARGHLMVRLQPRGQDELGALTTEFNRMADELRRAYLGVISTLAEVVEAKSHFTREHIERVERLTMATADALERRGWVRFSSQRRFILSVAAILHDVGKISISKEILNKSGPLDEGERSEMLTHPERGALIVERMGNLSAAAEIIRCAHEHYDGSGYPRGLKGEEIPIEARIILAVDAFDAMTADRPYSRRRPTEEAIAELRAEAGRQFDPVVVEALIEAVQLQPDVASGPSHETGLFRVLQPAGETPPAGLSALRRAGRG